MTLILPAPQRRTSSAFVNGATRMFGIIGDPIEQVKSPETVTAEFQARGRNAVLVPIEIGATHLASVFPALLKVKNLDGLIVTMPHKAAVIPFLDALAPRAQAMGAASVLAKSSDGHWLGELFDGAGCCTAIENRGVSIAGKQVQLLGAGGAGSAIAFEMLSRKPATLRISDPNSTLREQLISRLKPFAGTCELQHGLGPAEILVNASPVGMHAPNDCPVPKSYLSPDLVVMDCVLEPDPTLLLRLASEIGALAVSGREMLDSQIDAVCDFFERVNTSLASDLELRQ